MYFFKFLWNTLSSRANNPQNKNFWLPRVLEGVDNPNGSGKLLPLNQTNWDLGKLKGDAAQLINQTMTQQWEFVLQGTGKGDLLYDYQAIPNPANPDPNLSFPQVTVNGLENFFIMPNPEVLTSPEGYTCKVVLQFDYYDGTSNKPAVTPFSLTGKYLLSENLCLASIDDPTVDAGVLDTTIDGTGNFTANIDNAFVDAVLQIYVLGAGPDRKLKVTVTSLNMIGSTSGSLPTIDIEDLTIDTDIRALQPLWINAAKNAINSPEGAQGIFLNLNATINKPDFLNNLSNIFSEQFASILDKGLAPVPTGGLPVIDKQTDTTEVDKYLFDRIRAALNNPSSNFYLPKTILSINSPKLEPLNIDSISVPDQNISGITFTNVCITNINFVGLSNIIAPSDKMVFVQGNILQAQALIGTLNPPPVLDNGMTIPAPPIVGTGNFSMQTQGMPPLTGTFKVTITSGTFNFQTTASGDDLPVMTVTFNSGTLAIDPSAMDISLGIDSFFKDMINQIINKPDIKNQITGKINDVIANNMSAISDQLTQGARNGIASRLDN